MKEKLICIGGGVGPMAGVELHKKIIENTITDGTDQDHLPVYHFSRSHDIGDRTEYLLGIIDENPGYGMYRSVEIAVKAAEAVSKTPVIGVPCNTFHALRIFDLFKELVKENNLPVEILNMIEETGTYITRNCPGEHRIGLMSTTGTRKMGTYKKVLEPGGFTILEVPEEMQDELHESIYNKQWGIKAVSPVSEQSRKNFLRYTDVLTDLGAEVIILGCTEIPLALPEVEINGVTLVDPMTALARAFIREVDANKLKPFSEICL
jgi:aspartate racemase